MESSRGHLVPALTVVALLIAVPAAYLYWLGWHAEQTLDPITQDETGPYTTADVVGLVLTVGVLVVAAALVLRPLVVTLVVATWVTTVFSLDAATAPSEDASLWPVGAFLLLTASTLGVRSVALSVRAVRNAFVGRYTRRQRARAWR